PPAEAYFAGSAPPPPPLVVPSIMKRRGNPGVSHVGVRKRAGSRSGGLSARSVAPWRVPAAGGPVRGRALPARVVPARGRRPGPARGRRRPPVGGGCRGGPGGRRGGRG